MSHYGQCDVPEPNTDFVAIAAGYYHSVGLKSDGTIVAWGYNNFGQCDVPEPNSEFVDISSCWDWNLGLKSDGSVVGWPDIAHDIPEPNSGFVAAAAGGACYMGIREYGPTKTESSTWGRLKSMYR